jgi:MFS family permease
MSTIDRIEADRLPALIRSESAAAWTSLVSASAAWAFDAMDFQIFTLVLFPSVSDLVGSHDPGVVAYTGGLIVACKLVALGIGGIAFGIVADKIGRARTMVITVLIYSVFTGLSALAQSWLQLATLQALAGIGIGGEWAAGAALVAESWPERTRARALVVMQASFAIGFFLAAVEPRRRPDRLALCLSRRCGTCCADILRPPLCPGIAAMDRGQGPISHR